MSLLKKSDCSPFTVANIGLSRWSLSNFLAYYYKSMVALEDKIFCGVIA